MSTNMHAAAYQPIAVSNSAPSRGLYLVCIGHNPVDTSEHPFGFEADQPLCSRCVADLFATVIDLPLAYLVGPDAEARLADVAWLTPRAVRHEELVNHAARRGPVLPARFGAVFSTPHALDALITRHAHTIIDFLRHTTGCREMSVKLLVDNQRIRDAVVREQCDSAAIAASPGAKYLLEKRLKAQAAALADARIAELCSVLATELRPLASDLRPRRVLPSPPAEDQPHVAAHWAALVPDDEQPRFIDRITERSSTLAPLGVQLQVTGPWAPYSFCPALEP